MALRIAFMGTPEFSVSALNALHAAGHEIAAVYTQPPRPAGKRGLKLTPSPVHERAEDLGLIVRTPKSLRNDDAQSEFAKLDLDCAVVVAYGLILPKPVLDAPGHGCFNIHASLLPRWRGAAPIHRAIEAGDDETGVMIMKMDEGLDTGPVALKARTPIASDDTTGDVHDRLADLGGALIVDAMNKLEAGTLALAPQPDDGVTYAQKITNDERRMRFDRPATAVHDHARAMTPFPGAYLMAIIDGAEERIKVLRTRLVDADGVHGPAGTLTDGLTIDCAAGRVAITCLQRAGGKPMDAETFLRGATIDAVL